MLNIKKSVIFLAIFLIIGILLLLGACQEGVVTPPTNTPIPTSTTSIPNTTQTPTTGIISGIVKELGTDSPLSGVSVKLNNSIEQITGADGKFTFTEVPSGDYSLRIEKIGYKTEVIEDNLDPGESVNLTVQLKNTTVTSFIGFDQDASIYRILWSFYNRSRAPASSPATGDEEELKFGYTALGGHSKILFKFSFSHLPEKANIISAKLYLYKTKTEPESDGTARLSYVIYPITQDWDESSVTWYKRTANDLWSNEGGTYDEGLEITSGELSAGGWLSWVKFDILKAFDYWKTHNNYGLIITSNDVSSQLICTFYAKESFTEEMPYVEIKYYTP